jgi:multiple sugar transport system permease protein
VTAAALPVGTRRAIRRVGFWASILALVVWLLGPILWIAITSVQPEAAVTQAPPALTWNLNFDWYSQFLQNGDWLRSMLVSLEVALGTTAATIAIGSLAAYPLARLRVPGRNGIMALLIATQMMPPIVLLIPVLFMAREVHLTDTVGALILVNTAFVLPLVIWLLFNFFREVPRAIESAARIDGCTRLGTLFRVTVPAAAPGISATAILILIGTWNEFLFALILGDNDAVTVTRRIAFIEAPAGGVGAPPITAVATAGILAVLPCLVLVFFFHRRIVAGISEAFMKG